MNDLSLNLYRLQETFFNTPERTRFYCPSKIHWGMGAFDLARSALNNSHAVVFCDNALKGSHFSLSLQKSLQKNSFFFEIRNPPSPEWASRISRELGSLPEVVIALGGGSTMDAAKAVVATFQHGNLQGVGMGNRRGELPLTKANPLMIAFPSTAGTGAENSRYFVTYSEGSLLKVHGKSWELVYDWVFLDPEIAITSPVQVKIESALDAFVHLVEPFLARYEENWIVSSICLAALKELRKGLDIINEQPNSIEGMLKLMSASSMAGVVISNVRTGHIHEMAGVLLEKTGMTHPQSLAFYLVEGLKVLYEDKIAKIKLESVASHFGCDSFFNMMNWWKKTLDKNRILESLRNRISMLDATTLCEIESETMLKTLKDKVWNEKECPIAISQDVVKKIFKISLKSIQV